MQKNAEKNTVTGYPCISLFFLTVKGEQRQNTNILWGNAFNKSNIYEPITLSVFTMVFGNYGQENIHPPPPREHRFTHLMAGPLLILLEWWGAWNEADMMSPPVKPPPPFATSWAAPPPLWTPPTLYFW